jgi:hypothetical protein
MVRLCNIIALQPRKFRTEVTNLVYFSILIAKMTILATVVLLLTIQQSSGTSAHLDHTAESSLWTTNHL